MPNPYPRDGELFVLNLDRGGLVEHDGELECEDNVLPNSNHGWEIRQPEPGVVIPDSNLGPNERAYFPIASFAVKRNNVFVPITKWAVYIAVSGWVATGIAPAPTFGLNYYLIGGSAAGEFVGNSGDFAGQTSIPIPMRGTGLLGQLRGQVATHLFVFLAVTLPDDVPVIQPGRIRLLLRVLASSVGGLDSRPLIDPGVWG